MTTWENIDSIDTERVENLTVTSDAAFERVTSDERFEEEKNWWFLQQNTSWLVQEIPNISFLDIADTMLESKKTFHNRENWIIRVWLNWKSVEAQPQDAAILTYTPTYFDPTQETEIIPFDSINTASNLSLFNIANNKAIIWQSWVYRVAYWWICLWWTNDTVTISIEHYRNGVRIYNYLYDSFISSTWLSSWWKTWWLECEEWDEIYMMFDSNSYSSIRLQWLYLEIQFMQYKL